MKLALITGGSRGIGREITRLFAAKGYKTIFLYNNSADAASSLQRSAALSDSGATFQIPRRQKPRAARSLTNTAAPTFW